MDNKQIRIKILSSEGIIDEKNKTLTVFYDSNSWSRYNDFKRDLRAAAKNQDDSMLIDADNALKEHGYEVDATKKHKLNLNTPETVTYNIKKTEMKVGGKLTGNQSKLDLNKNGKLDSNDFKMLRGKMKTGGNTPDWKNGIEFGNPRNANANMTLKQVKDKMKKGTKLEKLIEAKRKGSKKTVSLGGIQVSLDSAIAYYKKLRYETGGGVGDDYMVTLETFEIDMPAFQRYLKSKNIKFKKHSNSPEVDYHGTHGSLKSMIDKYWAMDSDKNEKQEYYNMIEKSNKKANGGSLADTPESFPSTDAMSYGDGGSTSGWCYSIGGL